MAIGITRERLKKLSRIGPSKLLSMMCVIISFKFLCDQVQQKVRRITHKRPTDLKDAEAAQKRLNHEFPDTQIVYSPNYVPRFCD